MTKPRQGPLSAGEPVRLTDPKGRSHLITLRAGRPSTPTRAR
jgi:hypothetical protein